MGKFAVFMERRKTARKQIKCGECGIKAQRGDMRHVTLEVQKRYPLPKLFLRNLGGLILGQKPAKKGPIRYLFGHGFMELNTKRVKRWLCFNCFIQVLTPKEYDMFRNAYYDDLLIEDGEEKANELIAHIDEVFAAREEARQ